MGAIRAFELQSCSILRWNGSLQWISRTVVVHFSLPK